MTGRHGRSDPTSVLCDGHGRSYNAAVRRETASQLVFGFSVALRARAFLRLLSLFATIFCLATPADLSGQIVFRGGVLRARINPLALTTGRNEFELTQPQVERVPHATRRQLEQIKILVDEHQWDEALDVLSELIDGGTTGVVELSGGHYLGLRKYCHWQIARLPPEGLQVYRGRVDALAESWFQRGPTEPDLVDRLVQELYCSSFGDDALLALGDRALERRDYSAARRYWQQIGPTLRSPGGLSAWTALAGIDLSAHWPAVAQRWAARTAPPSWLAYPDPDVAPADVRARMVLVSIRAGDTERANRELELLRRMHPNASGRLAGREVDYATALSGILAQQKSWPDPPVDSDWPTYAGSATRSRRLPNAPQLTDAAWSKPVWLTPPPTAQQPSATSDVRSDLPLRHHPIVVGDLVLLRDAARVRAFDLATGNPALARNGTLFRRKQFGLPDGRLEARGERVVSGTARYTMDYHKGILFARLGQPVTARLLAPHAPGKTAPTQQLVGLDLRREGLLSFQVEPDDGSWSFEGAPVSDGKLVYVAIRHSDVKPRSEVAAFELATGRRVWTTSLCVADTPASGRGDEITSGLLTLVDDSLYYNTNLGVVAALHTVDGQVRWLRTYDRLAGMVSGTMPPHFERQPAPCVHYQGLLVVAPADSPAIFVVDADTGQTVWATNSAPDAIHLLGIAHGNLIATGHRCWGIDVRTGQVRFVWPESTKAGIRGRGRGVLAGNEVFWPTRREIYALDARQGELTRLPIDLTSFSPSGANLALAGPYLLIAGTDRLSALGSKPPANRAQRRKERIQAGVARPMSDTVWAGLPITNQPVSAGSPAHPLPH